MARLWTSEPADFDNGRPRERGLCSTPRFFSSRVATVFATMYCTSEFPGTFCKSISLLPRHFLGRLTASNDHDSREKSAQCEEPRFDSTHILASCRNANQRSQELCRNSARAPLMWASEKRCFSPQVGLRPLFTLDGAGWANFSSVDHGAGIDRISGATVTEYSSIHRSMSCYLFLEGSSSRGCTGYWLLAPAIQYRVRRGWREKAPSNETSSSGRPRYLVLVLSHRKIELLQMNKQIYFVTPSAPPCPPPPLPLPWGTQ